MGDGGDRGFLFRALGVSLLAMVFWRLAGAGGILAGGGEILANREAMAGLAPWVLLGLFFLRGPLPARKSAARVVGFQFLNLGFLAGAAVYGLAAVPLELPAPAEGKEHAPSEADWVVRDRLREINAQMEELEKESAEAAAASDNGGENRRQEARRQQQIEAMEKLRSERSRLAEELNRRGKVFEEKQEREREDRKKKIGSGPGRGGRGGVDLHPDGDPRHGGGIPVPRGRPQPGRVSGGVEQQREGGKLRARSPSSQAQPELSA